MAPIRRYLRITKFSVLEVRIYLHTPSDAAWLLSSRDNVLDRVIQEVRPKVLPKLREENQNAKSKAKGKKKRGIKDVASQDDFEVSIFLKETSTRHSLLTKRKEFSSKPKLRSNGKGLTGWLEGNKKEDAIDLEEGNEMPQILRDEGEGDVVEMQDIPEADSTRTGRKRRSGEIEGQDADDALFVSSSDEEFFATQRAQPSRKRQRSRQAEIEQLEDDDDDDDDDDDEQRDDKKKFALNTNFDGFSIYGRILCLIVTRKGRKEALTSALHDAQPAGGSQMMENFIATQVAREAGLSEEDD